MNEVYKKDPLKPCNTILMLGRQGENKAHQICFDLNQLVTHYGSGTALLVHQRNGDAAPYIVPTSVSNNILFWLISNIDTLYAGNGKAELRYIVNDIIVKSVTFQTRVMPSMTGDITIPPAFQSWYDALINYIESIGASPENVSQAVADYMAEHPVTAPVTSVNQQTGDVSITAESLGADRVAFADIDNLFRIQEG